MRSAALAELSSHRDVPGVMGTGGGGGGGAGMSGRCVFDVDGLDWRNNKKFIYEVIREYTHRYV